MPVTKRCRLLCPDCGELKKITDIVETNAVLTCGHWRTTALLPLKRGHISLEHIRTPVGARMFPYDERDYTWRLDDEQ